MELISVSAAMQQVVAEASRAARFPGGRVLISGETGVGRQHLARYIHHHSDRHRHPFLVVDCADASAEWTIAGTAAEPTPVARLFCEPNVGTIFFDGVQQLSLPHQAALMRILDERLRHERRGGLPDGGARVIASALPGLFEGVASGWFSAELYYRLNTFHLDVPPLRERADDVEPLLQHFIAAAAERRGVGCPPLDERWRRVMHRYSWPGNARELHNLAESIVGRGVPGPIRAPRTSVH